MARACKPLTVRGWLADLDPIIGQAILESGRLVTFRKGKTLFSPDDHDGGVFGIVSGSVCLAVSGDDGPSLPGHIMRPGGWFGYGSVLLLRNRTLLAQANEELICLHLSRAAISRLRDMGQEYQRALSLLPQYGEAVLLSIVSDLLIPDSDRRLAAVVLRVTEAWREDGSLPSEPLPLTQELLGQLANASRQTVGRFVKKVSKEGLIEWRYGKITVLDAGRLEDFKMCVKPMTRPTPSL